MCDHLGKHHTLLKVEQNRTFFHQLRNWWIYIQRIAEGKTDQKNKEENWNEFIRRTNCPHLWPILLWLLLSLQKVVLQDVDLGDCRDTSSLPISFHLYVFVLLLKMIFIGFHCVFTDWLYKIDGGRIGKDWKTTLNQHHRTHEISR